MSEQQENQDKNRKIKIWILICLVFFGLIMPVVIQIIWIYFDLGNFFSEIRWTIKNIIEDFWMWFFMFLYFIGFPTFAVFAYLKHRRDKKEGKPKNIFTSSGTGIYGLLARIVVVGIIGGIVYLHSADIISMNIAGVLYSLVLCGLLFVWYKS